MFLDDFLTTVKRVSIGLLKGNIFERPHIDLNFHGLAGAAERDAFNRSDVAIIATPGQRDVSVGNHHIVGRVETEPAATRNENGNPGVGRLGALDLRTGAYVTADITRRQPQGTQSAYHDVRKILTDAPPVAQHIGQRNVDGRRLRMVFEIFVNAMRQILCRINRGRSGANVFRAYSSSCGPPERTVNCR